MKLPSIFFLILTCTISMDLFSNDDFSFTYLFNRQRAKEICSCHFIEQLPIDLCVSRVSQFGSKFKYVINDNEKWVETGKSKKAKAKAEYTSLQGCNLIK